MNKIISTVGNGPCDFCEATGGMECAFGVLNDSHVQEKVSLCLECSLKVWKKLTDELHGHWDDFEDFSEEVKPVALTLLAIHEVAEVMKKISPSTGVPVINLKKLAKTLKKQNQ